MQHRRPSSFATQNNTSSSISQQLHWQSQAAQSQYRLLFLTDCATLKETNQEVIHLSKNQKPDLREIRPHGTSNFPCGFYHAVGGSEFKLRSKHHWHDEIEMIYFKSGKYIIDVNMDPYEINHECFCFINSGELHRLRSLTQDFEEKAIVFNPRMLRFMEYDPIEKYILEPMAQYYLTFPRFLEADDPIFADFRREYEQFGSYFTQPSKLKETSETGINMDDVVNLLKSKLSLLNMLTLLIEHNHMNSYDQMANPRIESIKTVLSYISTHYQEKLYIQDLSSLVNMNEQYFCRFFKKVIGKPPIEYINDYRLNKVISLLENTELPITEICMECGFNNIGNFQRLFKRKTGTTPLRYRKQKTTHSFSESQENQFSKI